MRKILISIITLCSLYGLQAQDLIVTNNGDSIECQTTEVKGDLIHITFIEDGEEKKAIMQRSMVAHYEVDYKNNWEDPTPPPKGPVYPKFRVSAGGGLGNLIGGIPSNIQDDLIPYVEELKSGNHFAADISFYMEEHVGIGIKYSLFKTQNRLTGVSIIDSLGNLNFGVLEDDITIHYMGPALALRKTMPRGSAHLVSNLSLGVLTYFNDATVIDKYRISGSTFAFSGDVGFDFEIQGGFHLGIGLGLTIGIIKELRIQSSRSIEIVDLTGLEYSNASRFDLGIGLRYFI